MEKIKLSWYSNPFNQQPEEILDRKELTFKINMKNFELFIKKCNAYI